ncbi:MAG: hypothetical protein O2907_07205 [Proteobacteria bacterium]|nr:hypothetical protein [Pseudomonadota bacterium]MDA1064102.1 hypothetical protein [Pseudomonadota bacterium]
MTTLFRCAAGLLLLASLAACGKDAEITCDDVQTYQLAVAGKRVEVPAELDPLDPLKEVPLPAASPRAERPAGSPCIDRPPKVSLGG